MLGKRNQANMSGPNFLCEVVIITKVQEQRSQERVQTNIFDKEISIMGDHSNG